MPSGGFESTIPASERLQTHALDHAATGIDNSLSYCREVISVHAIKSFEGVASQPRPFLNSALAKGMWSHSRPGRFNPEEGASATCWIGG
jgi:hypothetical protein